MGGEIIICGKRFAVDREVYTFEDPRPDPNHPDRQLCPFDAYLRCHFRNTYDLERCPPEGQEGHDPACEPCGCSETSVGPPDDKAAHGRLYRYTERWKLRNVPKELRHRELKKFVNQFVVHFDGLFSAEQCFRVLHNERGLSAHFLIDGKGIIYQTLDLEHCAFHAAGVNQISVGVEMQSRGRAWGKDANFYKNKPEERRSVFCTIHGQRFLAWDFTEPQYEAMIELSRVLSEQLDIPFATPTENGQPIWAVVPTITRFKGFIGHYHITDNKWDPGPFDFLRLFRGVSARVLFPLMPPSKEKLKADDEERMFNQAAVQHYRASEELAEEQGVGAHFPMGPLGSSQLWHGGLHLAAPRNTPVYAPMTGEVVLARMDNPCTVGSCNFVLLRHTLHQADQEIKFYTLFFHLAKDVDIPYNPRSVPGWITRVSDNPTLKATLESGQVTRLNLTVQDGEVIGYLDLAGPEDTRDGRRLKRASQVHFAVFSLENLGEKLDPGFWRVVESDGSSRLADDRSLLDLVDRPLAGRPRDGRLSRQELREFFHRDRRREELRRVAARHLSEWTDGGWEEDLAQAGDFADLPRDARRALINTQIKPTLWWTASAARHAGLPDPKDALIYSYHPVTFIIWLRKLTQKMKDLRPAQVEEVKSQADAQAFNKSYDKRIDAYKLDSESTVAMISKDELSDLKNQDMTLEQLIEGYPDDKGKQ